MDGLQLDTTALAVMNTPAKPKPGDTPEKIRDAAQQFEGLLMQQLMRTVRESGGWLGTGEDATGECATDFAEQQFASALSAGGGLGLAHMIADGLKSGG